MTTTRKTALVAGVFFLITEVTAIAALLSYGTILTDPTYIIDGSVDNTRVLVGAFLEVLLAIAVVGTSVTLYPVIKTYGPGLAIGHVAGRLIEADEARSLGLINCIAVPDQLAQETRALAETVAAKLGVAVTIGKGVFYDQAELGLEAAYALAGEAMVTNMLDPDTAEGVSAFLDKRKPAWCG